MNIIAITDLAPLEAENGRCLRFWHLCERGRYPCHYLEDRTRSGNNDIEALRWQSLTKTEYSTLIETCRNHSNGGGKIFVQGLELALQLSKDGIVPNFVDVVDSYSVYFLRRFRYLSWTTPLKRANALVQVLRHRMREKRARAQHWIILAAAEADSRQFLGGSATVIAAPNGSAWVDLSPLYVERANANVIGFHGNMTWDPNVSAAEYVAIKVMPYLRQHYPDAKFHIIGGPVVPRIAALGLLPGVEVVGRVDDLRTALTEIDVYVMPMLQGAGVKNKLMEAMAAGLPVVTNKQGAEAFLPKISSSISLAEAPVSLAEAIFRLLDSESARAKASKAVRTFAVDHFKSKSLIKWIKENEL